MRVVCIGDVHGHLATYRKMIYGRYKNVRTIQVGDMGIGFPDGGTLYENEQLGGFHGWIRGNHDNPSVCRQTPGYLGDYGYLEDLNLFYLGGAYSIDWAYRVPGRSWWPDEELSYPELAKAIDLYLEKKPRFVVSHECPVRINEYLLQVLLPAFRNYKGECKGTRTAAALQQMLDLHRPEEWVFGHYHISVSFDWRGTKFTCVNELDTYAISDEPQIVLPGAGSPDLGSLTL